MTDPFHVFGHEVFVNCMIGIATFGGEGGDRDTVLRQAKLAMRDARGAGEAAGKLETSEAGHAPVHAHDPSRGHPADHSKSSVAGNGFRFFSQELNDRALARMALERELHYALERQELVLHYQPKVGLANGRVLGAEALVRWQHPQRGLVPPVNFIPFAEQTGFVRQLTLWVFEEVARLLASPQARHLPLRVSVNLSTRDLLDPELSTRLAGILARHGVQASAFCLEITESAIMDDPQRAEAMLNRLSEQGFKLSIDDFGTGYSSLAYLKRLPVDELKIDKSFVMGMEAGEDDAMIVRSTIDLAHNLGLTVVAEGVETAAILARLRTLACDEAQGYHIARPLPVDDFLAWQARQGEASPL